MEDKVILVDEHDVQIGTMDKLEAHLKGALHRAFSIFIFNDKNELLLQQRAHHKYHSAGKWTNSCCSHPRPEENTLDAAYRRLEEEMGMTCDLHYAFNFTYKAAFSNDLIEHEFDHVYFGFSNELPIPNPEEVADFKYVTLQTLKQDMDLAPNDYSAWLKVCFDKIITAKAIS